jgi:hypothetical protein
MNMKIKKKHIMPVFLMVLCAGCQNARELTDADLDAIMLTPRPMEKFHYAGSRDDLDYFVGEQWSANSYPPAAKRTEIYYKTHSSRRVQTRFSLTKDVTKWKILKTQASQQGAGG